MYAISSPNSALIPDFGQNHEYRAQFHYDSKFFDDKGYKQSTALGEVAEFNQTVFLLPRHL
jgi:hypothetical protein